MWNLMIILHALAGIISFATGVIVLSPTRAEKYPRIFYAYIISLIGLVIFMAGAMASHWKEISLLEQTVFSMLIVLGFFMLYRAFDAKKLLHKGEKNAYKYIDAIGFTLISLFDGFVIVGAIDLKMHPLIVISAAVLAIFIGNFFIKKAKTNYSTKR